MLALPAIRLGKSGGGCTGLIGLRQAERLPFQALVQERDCAGIALTTLQALPPPGLTQFANSANKRDPPPK
jgi:hypothetical protein